ncbi:MAG: GNAT family N-acetyltransferase [Candidatus Cloacimonetes bacterium]|nr:GNAT family N-acetyltransferase [Candidatus Cloacimonadota bacterium]
MRSDIEIRKPETKQEFEQYYNLRWQILRQPWSQLKGSEQDEMDKNSTHFMAVIDNKIIGCGRGHFNSDTQAQIRYMAVDQNYRKLGIGLWILKALEDYLTGNGAKEIILKARGNAIPFYERNGYVIYEEGEILFGEIKHYWMRKK